MENRIKIETKQEYMYYLLFTEGKQKKHIMGFDDDGDDLTSIEVFSENELIIIFEIKEMLRQRYMISIINEAPDDFVNKLLK